MNTRLHALRAFLQENNADGILLTSPVSIHYYTSFHGFALDEREGYALITENDVFLLTSKLYEGAVKNIPEVITQIYSSENPLSPLVKKLLFSKKPFRLGVEEANLTLSEYTKFKKLATIVPLDIRDLRMIKTTDEIAKIQKACSVADNALAIVRKKIQDGMTEKQLALLLEQEIKAQGATISFRPIVAFAEDAAIPHHLTGDKKLKTNDLILIDFGAKVAGYCSDMTRTFFIGKPTPEQEKVYTIVKDAQQAAVDYCKSQLAKNKSEGVKASSADKAARAYIISHHYPSIPHSLGHGIGLEVHEPPYLGPGSDDMLEEGMVFSIEPGIYIPEKFGVRIEDLFAIQEGNLLQLTHAPLY